MASTASRRPIAVDHFGVRVMFIGGGCGRGVMPHIVLLVSTFCVSLSVAQNTRNVTLVLTLAAVHCHRVMVEAAGVEPASEKVTGREPTCLVQFMLLAFTRNVRGGRSERTRNANR